MSNTIVVIGGGAAGLMAAGRAASMGSRVILVEKNDRVGKKLGITGKGRCNVTNDSTVQEMMKNIPENGKFLYSCLNGFNAEDTMSFFRERGVRLKTERGNRVFPESDRAGDIVSALYRYCRDSGVEFVTRRAQSVNTEDGRIVSVTAGGKEYRCDCALIATGGISYKGTGSDGWGHKEAARLGHTVTELRASLVPLESDDACCGEMQGLSLKNVGITVKDKDGKKVYSDFGEMLFTHFGVSGPVILSASSHLRNWDSSGYDLFIDLKPALDEKKLDARILRDFDKYSNRDFENSLGDLVPGKMAGVLVKKTGIDPGKKINSVTKDERRRLVETLKQFHVHITGKRPVDEAIVTSGGVAVNEIDPKTMQSKIIDGLFFAGEIIDVDAYTGGYNLQIAWSTGNAAARGMNGYRGETNE